MYASRDKNEFFAYCQGDNFGEEYMVRIKYNKDYVVNKISCTCGCMQDDGYCKHVAATLMYIDKTKEFKENRLDVSLKQLSEAMAIYPYHPLKEKTGCLVSQKEHTVIVEKEGCTVTTL